MDDIRQKTQQLLNKLQNKYGVAAKSPRPSSATPQGSPFFKDCEDAGGGGGGGEGEGKIPVIHNWFLVDPCNKKLRLPRTMLFLGRDECDIIIQSGTVDKRHAVITFDLYLSRFKVKDLSTTNGTYVNESRIPEQEYVTLNHMDTIRLGYDILDLCCVYHMEQGEPCTGDSPHSPSPPLSLQQSPPPPSVHLSGGDLACSTEATKASADPTGWTRGHKDSTRPMAECQGCIAEQRIEHTCTHAIPSHLHHVHHHHETCPSRDPGDHQFVEVQRKHTEKAERDEPGKEEDCESVSPEPDHSDTESPSEQKTRQARNTWPRKKVRQSRRAVAADLFAAAAAADDEDGVGEDVSGEILVENGTNYFVSVDDSAVGESGRGRMVVEYSLSRTGSVHRIPRGNSKNPLPPELETVKKGTPLYGQPSWWGEDTQTGGDKDSMDPQKPEARSPRPSSLVMHGDGSHPHHPQEQHPKGYYMEIPHHAATPERDKPQRDKTTPARSSTSSISKDSLVLSPVSARGRSVDKESDPGRSASGGFCAAEAALSFTVEFGDEKKPKLKSGASLSQFVPMKLRNSLRTHARPEKASSRGRDSDGSCKNSEERELSPTASVKQRRLEEQYAASSETSSKGKSSRRSSGQGTGVGSLKSSDFGLEITTPVSTKSRKDGDRRTREAEKEVDKKPPQPQEPRKSSSSSSRVPITKGSSKAKPQPSAAAIAASVQAAQYADSTAFLIDRMFAGDTESPRSASSDPERCESPTAPEHVMYKEAREYDRASQRGSGTYRVSGGGSGKPVQKQKSLSKSPASTSKSPAVSTSSAKSPAATASPRTSKKMAGSKTPEKQSRLVKEKSVEAERPLVSAVPAPPPAQTLPEAPSPITGGDQEDKVSEAGTYTIEVEEDGEEELMARQQIDEIFGVDDNGFNFERPVIGAEGGPLRGQGQEVEEEEGEEKTLHEDEGESMEPGCHTPCDIEGDNVFDDDEEEGVMSRSMGEEEVPSWVSQLNSLTSSIRHSPASPGEASRKDVTAKGTDEASKKPPQGLSRKRPGTGRKLPSIPLASDQSPVSSEHSSHLHHSPISPAGAPAPTRLENGHDHSTDDSPSRSVQFSPDLSSSGAKSRLEGSPCGSEDLGTSSINSGAIPKGSSVYSRGSIDTELLLRDTETVMAAMEARIGFSRDDKGEEEEGAESDTDLTSTVAMVNGDEDYVKPTKYHSPRDKMAGKVGKDKDNSNIRIASASSSRKILSRSQSEQKPPLKSSRSGAGVSVVSDVLSRSNSLDQSFQSDASDGGSSDRTETTFSRSGSRGKGTVTMSKPNRALALRQAHAHRTETTDTARSRASAASTAASSARRSSSIHGTPRTSYSDRTGTEASLGAQIVKKARDNTTASKARESSVTRQERAQRDSLRATDRRSSASSSSSSTISSAKKERDIRTLKSQLRSTPGNKDLAITGFSRCSQSQPGSRSNSPKAAERMAWKRRKDYDPRKSVADAKAKGKEPRPKPKVQSSSLYKQTMSRSASFTNTAELSGRARHDTYNVDSISSVEDLSSAATAASDPYGGTGLRRAFIPFHNPLRSNRLSHSADEDEAGTFPPSQEPSSRSKPPAHPVSLMLHKSAFTPPLSKLHTPSPDSPSPQASLLLRRRTVGADFDEAGASTAASSHRTQADSYATQSSSPQSYDSLIVSSIYQLSLKLKTTMDKALMKLREQDRASITPSPIDDFLGHPAKSDIPAWKSANQELTGVLKNLRKMEHHLHLMERALFPDEDTDTTVSGMSTSEKHKYFQEIERIRSELADFHPIDGPPSQDPGSPEMDELSKNIH
ncbi:hypothetical protein ACOMHN_027826 [Nucella lapillus]